MKFFEAVKMLKALGCSFKNPKKELNCVKIELRENYLNFACTDTRIMIYGSEKFESNLNLDLIIDMNTLLKLKKPSKFEFSQAGVRVDTTEGIKTLKNEAGRYPDWERILPRKIDSTLTCDFSQLGTLLEALGGEVMVTQKGKELEFFQSDTFWRYGKGQDFDSLECGSAFKMNLPFDGKLAHRFLCDYKVISYLAKHDIKELKMDILDKDTRRLHFEKDGIKALVMTCVL